MNITDCPAGYANDDWLDTRRFEFNGLIASKMTECTVPIEALEVLCYIWVIAEGLSIPFQLFILVQHRRKSLLMSVVLGFALSASGFQIAFLLSLGVPGPTTLLFWGLTFSFTQAAMLMSIYELIVVIPGMFALRYDFHKDRLLRINIGLGMSCTLVTFLCWAVLAPIEFSDVELRTTILRVGFGANALYALGIGFIPYNACNVMIRLLNSVLEESQKEDLKLTKKKFLFVRALVIPNTLWSAALWILPAAFLPFYWFLVFPQLFTLTVYKYGIFAMKIRVKQGSSQVTTLEPTDSAKNQMGTSLVHMSS